MKVGLFAVALISVVGGLYGTAQAIGLEDKHLNVALQTNGG